MPDTKRLDNFELVLSDGLEKLCHSCGLFEGELLTSPDIDGAWDGYLEKYVADAVLNFNEYPEVAIAWAAYLGMGVAHNWDSDWKAHKDDAYESYYGSRGWDDMDEHIVGDLLHLKEDWAKKVSDCLVGCADAALSLIRHEGIEAQTADGFYCLVRVYCVFFRLGVTAELSRLGYKKVALPKISVS